MRRVAALACALACAAAGAGGAAASHEAFPETVVVLYGAIGRHNFGDVLMAEVAAALLRRQCGYVEGDIAFADVLAKDMRLTGGANVQTLADFFTDDRRVDVVAVGGEVLNLGLYGAAHMILGGGGVAEGVSGGERVRLQEALTSNAFHPLRLARSVYVPQRGWFKNAGAMVASTLGGDVWTEASHEALRGLDFASLREEAVYDYALAPDCAVLVKELFGDRVAAFAEAARLDEKRYVAVQFGAAAAEEPKFTENLAAALARIAIENRLDVVLFAAGAAPAHDSMELLRDVAQRTLELAPHVRVDVFSDLNVWSITALIARAGLVLSTSLHVRIAAFAFARPRLAIVASRKYRRFVDLWDRGVPDFAKPGVPDFAKPNATDLELLAGVASRALAEPASLAAFFDDFAARRAAKRYLEDVFEPYASRLSKPCLPRRLAALDAVEALDDAPLAVLRGGEAHAEAPEPYRERIIDQDVFDFGLGPSCTIYDEDGRVDVYALVAGLVADGRGQACVVSTFSSTHVMEGVSRSECLQGHGIDRGLTLLKQTVWAETSETAEFFASDHLLAGGYTDG
mmetsp:Transcript_10250/g.35542  ORF Transcript_10250/g.35542 Transcript_10250/m.35542 type:complete len:571 (+) Transcript_10250:119-1831(+)